MFCGEGPIGATPVQVDPLSPRRVLEKDLVPQRLDQDRVHRARASDEINSPPLRADRRGRLDFERLRIVLWCLASPRSISKRVIQHADPCAEKNLLRYRSDPTG